MASSGSTVTYVYCVVKTGSGKPVLGKAPRGLPGAAAPRLLEVGGGYDAVVASAPLARFSAEAIEARLRDLEWVAACGAAHEAVVEHGGRRGTVVPMKLFTIFSSDERARAHVAKMRRTLDRVVARIAGCEEWGLRVLFDEARAAERATARAPAPATGAAFLQRKKDLGDAKRRLANVAQGEVEDLYRRLARTVKKAVRRAPPSRELAGRVLLDAAFLVPHANAKTFRAAVTGAAKGLAKGGYHVTLTGPWPAYSFVGPQ
jgi:hypothetical protein